MLTGPEQTLYQELGSRECIWKVISESTRKDRENETKKGGKSIKEVLNSRLTAVGTWDPTGDTPRSCVGPAAEMTHHVPES